ncbi:MAG: glycosyltransferase family protein [Candidatus Omnitrophica bacterium]|nr:glycosyltransferase family protein [Candidatus Omnitrophota bacterium]
MDRLGLKKIATIEARMSSSRLPGKVLMPLADRPSLERMVERIRRAKSIDEVVVATTVSAADDAVVEWAQSAGVAVFRGSEEDVLLRVLEAARAFHGGIICELTGDCPLIDPEIIDALMDRYVRSNADYVSNILRRTYPRGLDTQIFSTQVLEEVDRLTQDPADRENVSLYIYEHPERFRLDGMEAPEPLRRPKLRWTVDTQEDYAMIAGIYAELYPKNPAFTSFDVMAYLDRHPELRDLNAHVVQKKVRG